MGIGAHDALVFRHCPQLGIQPLLPDLNKAIGGEAVGGAVQRPVRGRGRFHVHKQVQTVIRRPALEQAAGGLSCSAGHCVVVVGVRGVVGDNGLRPEVVDAALDELHQLQVGDGVHFDVGEIRVVDPFHAQDLQRLFLVQLQGAGAVQPRGGLADHDRHSDPVALLHQTVNGAARSARFIIRVGDNKQIIHNASPLSFYDRRNAARPFGGQLRLPPGGKVLRQLQQTAGSAVAVPGLGNGLIGVFAQLPRLSRVLQQEAGPFRQGVYTVVFI